MLDLEVKTCDSVSVKIFIAGDYNQVQKTCNDYCYTHGCCVNIIQNTYVYSAGPNDAGVIVELINYPRFPKTTEELTRQALTIAYLLRENLNQDSFTIQTLPGDSLFYSYRHLRGK